MRAVVGGALIVAGVDAPMAALAHRNDSLSDGPILTRRRLCILAEPFPLRNAPSSRYAADIWACREPCARPKTKSILDGSMA